MNRYIVAPGILAAFSESKDKLEKLTEHIDEVKDTTDRMVLIVQKLEELTEGVESDWLQSDLFNQLNELSADVHICVTATSKAITELKG